MGKKVKKKVKPSFQQELKKKQQSESISEVPVILKPDMLDRNIRIGFTLLGYLLFIPGSLGCLIMGYAGSEKKGSSEVILIGWIMMFIHAMFICLMAINPVTAGVMPVQVIFVILLLIPLVLIITGTVIKFPKSITLQTVGLVLLIPHYSLVAVLNPSIIWDKQRANEVITKANVEIIRKAVEKYASQNKGVYPPDIATLVQQGKLAVPENPFSTPPSQMKDIGFGTSPYSGEFTYLPVKIDGETRAYYLLGYGKETGKGKDVNSDGSPDHVITVLEGISVPSNLQGDAYQDFLAKKPPLDKLLK